MIGKIQHYKREEAYSLIHKMEDAVKAGLAKRMNVENVDTVFYLNARLKDVSVHPNKRLNILSVWNIFKPKEFEDEQDEFFKEVFDFCRKFYGDDNIIQGYVTKNDEGIDYVKVLVLPVNDKNHISSRDVFRKGDLFNFHKGLTKLCHDKFGMGEVTEESVTSELVVKTEPASEPAVAVAVKTEAEISEELQALKRSLEKRERKLKDRENAISAKERTIKLRLDAAEQIYNSVKSTADKISKQSLSEELKKESEQLQELRNEVLMDNADSTDSLWDSNDPLGAFFNVDPASTSAVPTTDLNGILKL